jgi:hypothetical protein
LTTIDRTTIIPHQSGTGFYQRNGKVTLSTAFRIASLCALSLSLSIATTANAASMFTVTDLGASYTLQQDSAGTIHSVTSGDGSQTYAFEKSAVNQISGFSVNPINDYITTYLFQVGTEQLGYYNAPGYSPNVPTNFYYLGDWWTQGTTSPVTDVNSQGQIVGQSSGGSNVNGFAAFSGANGLSHIDSMFGTYGDNNLNNYIANNLGVYLSSALKIDNLGAIIAEGTLNGNNQYFLLTPDGSPTPAPEPSTFAILAVGVTALCIRSARRGEVRTEKTLRSDRKPA